MIRQLLPHYLRHFYLESYSWTQKVSLFQNFYNSAFLQATITANHDLFHFPLLVQYQFGDHFASLKSPITCIIIIKLFPFSYFKNVNSSTRLKICHKCSSHFPSYSTRACEKKQSPKTKHSWPSRREMAAQSLTIRDEQLAHLAHSHVRGSQDPGPIAQSILDSLTSGHHGFRLRASTPLGANNHDGSSQQHLQLHNLSASPHPPLSKPLFVAITLSSPALKWQIPLQFICLHIHFCLGIFS